jgi:hypothetical protein
MAKGKRLNDTAVLQAAPACGEMADYTTKEIRKIENGYVTRETRSGDGSYNSTERYSPNHPNADNATFGSGNAMAKAVDFMKK